jgi:dTMP kinase
MYKKLIIVFEGIEGSGKSYHIQNISNYLKKNKIKFIKIREPGGSLNSEKIRKLILNKNSKFNKFTDFLLYMAARNENLNNIIFKNYKKKIILIDRFLDSTIAYQHYGMGVNLKAIKYINDLILKNIKIDFTFLNLVNRKNLNLRLKKRKNLNRKIILHKFIKLIQK